RSLSRRHPEERAKRASKGESNRRAPGHPPIKSGAGSSRAAARPPQDDAVARAPAPVSTAVQTVTASADESGMRLDRFFEAHFPRLSFSHLQRIIRKREARGESKRADPKDRLETAQQIRIPPLKLNQPKQASRL